MDKFIYLEQELTILHETTQIIVTQYPTKLAKFFTHSLNLFINQIRKSTLYNHLDTIILEQMMAMMQTQSEPCTLCKVRIHTDIDGPEQVEQLAKIGQEQAYRVSIYAYENGNSCPC